MHAVVGTEAGQRLVQGLLPHISNNHLHSGSRKGLGHPQAHATRAASDEGGLSCNVFHAGFSCVVGPRQPEEIVHTGVAAEPTVEIETPMQYRRSSAASAETTTSRSLRIAPACAKAVERLFLGGLGRDPRLRPLA